MRMIRRMYFLAIMAIMSLAASAQEQGTNTQQWSVEKAQKWGEENPWFCGVNYIPANAINYTAMWDKTSFSPKVIRNELKLMSEMGLNCARFVMQYKVYEEDPKYFLRTLDRVLALCDEAGVKAMPIFFDDCIFGTANDPKTGVQPEPLEGWYAWAWSPSPGLTMVVDERTHPLLEKYVKAVLARFRDDKRIMLWDLYNEPTGNPLSERAWPLLKKVFMWAREIAPSQPVSAGLWNGNEQLNEFLAANSDIITFHLYANAEATEKRIQELQQYKRPVICTEWMNRVAGSTIKDNLAIFEKYNAGCMLWGLVNGKTQTHLCWGHRPEQLPYKGVWQHDIYRNDLTPYDAEEIEMLKAAVARKNGTGK